MSVQKVSCPGCGANVEIPTSLTRAHCVYCGSQILVSSEGEEARASREADLKILLDLLDTALQAENSSDILRYANSVLEIDPNSSRAWYCKGLATSFLSTWTADGFREGRTYLDKALQIDPDAKEYRLWHARWAWGYVRYLYELSQQQWNTAYNVWRAECLASFGSIAQEKAAPYAAAANGTLDKALTVLAEVPPSLERDQWESAILVRKIEFLHPSVTGGRFGDSQPFRRRLEGLTARAKTRQDVHILPLLRQKLNEFEAEIAEIEQHGGFMARRKLGNLRKLQEECGERIERAEELAASEGPPRPAEDNKGASRSVT